MLGRSSTFLDLSSPLSLSLSSPFFALGPFPSLSSSSGGPPPKNFKSGARVTRATNASRRPATTITRRVSFDRPTQNIAAARYPWTSQKRKRDSPVRRIARVSSRFASPLCRRRICLYDRRRDAGSRSELEKKNRLVTNRREISMERGRKKKYGETKNRSPGLGQAVLLKRRSAFSLPLTRSTRFVTERRMHFAGYYVDTKVARASHRRFLGKIVIVSPTPRRESEDRVRIPGLFRKYTCNRATGQFVVTLFRCTLEK